VKKWKCPICDQLNPEDTDTCEECGADREESSYDAIADEEDSDE
jgi:RNA polymerase subunit RPABC4/transcription elongation factor Spt4